MDNNQITKYDNGQLTKVGNAIAVTNKLLALAEPQLIPYRKKEKWGFCTPDKKIVIDCVYEDAYQFFEGLAKVKLNGKYGFVNKKGIVVIPLIYDDAYLFLEGLTQIKIRWQIWFYR
jgi:translation initiation factor 6 (eIF-6)